MCWGNDKCREGEKVLLRKKGGKGGTACVVTASDVHNARIYFGCFYESFCLV